MSIKLSEVIKNYNNESSVSKRDKSNLVTALYKYTLPELGFVISENSNNRFCKKDIESASNFCESINVNTKTKEFLREAQENYFKKNNILGNKANYNRRSLKCFLEYLDIFTKQKGNKTKTRKTKYELSRKKVTDLSHIENSKSRREPKESIKISFDVKEYSGDPTKNKLELERIQQELNDFSDFLGNKRKFTIKNNMVQVLRMLGWQYQQSKDLTKVSLYTLVVKYDIYPKILEDEDYIDNLVNKAKAIEIGKEKAKETIKFIEDFFTNYKIYSKGTKEQYIKCLINIAKYHYKDITNIEEYNNYEDISVIKRLRTYSNNLPEDKTKRKNLNNQIEWEIIWKVFLELKRRSDLKQRGNYKKLTLSAKAKHLQKFLVLGFFILVPTPRQRVIRELKLGNTLKYGNFKNDIFIPYEQLKNKSEATYWIHLQPEDYKTGDTYGEFIGEFKNYYFEDGTNFYQYLELWIKKYRKILLDGNKDHGFLFMMPMKKEPMNEGSMSSFIAGIFNSTTNLKVTPHALRHSYTKYLYTSEASEQEKRSAAHWKRHSIETAQKEYTHLTHEELTKPGATIGRL